MTTRRLPIALAVVSAAILAMVPVALAQRASTSFGAAIGIDERLGTSSAVASSWARLRLKPGELPLFVRLTVGWAEIETDSTNGQWRVLDDRLDAYRKLAVPVVMTIRAESLTADRSDAWIATLKSVVSHVGGRVAGYQIDLPPGAGRSNPRTYAFFLKLASVNIHAADPSAIVVQATIGAADVAWQTSLYTEGTAAYVDVVPLGADASATNAESKEAALVALVRSHDPTAAIWTVAIPIGDSAGQTAPEAFLASALAKLGTNAGAALTFAGGPAGIGAALDAAAEMKDLLGGDLVALDERTVALRLDAGGRDVTSTVPHRLLLKPSTGATYLALWGSFQATPLTVALTDPAARAPTIRDPVRHRVSPAQGFTWDAGTRTSTVTGLTIARPVILDFSFDTTAHVVHEVDVAATAALSVDEIVSRNQQAQTAQQALFRTLVASLRSELHFRAGPGQVFDVVSENRFFSSPDSVEWEEISFSVNGTRWGPDHPGVPLLQAEKVSTLPLDLRLTADYRYRLEGTETVANRTCYVVAFDPVDAGQARYRGRVWIDTETFLRLKVQTIQTHLSGEIASSEEITAYEQVGAVTRRPVYLMTHLSTKQLLLVAGRNLLLEKEQTFSNYRIDAADFEEVRQAARSSDHVMFRDTDAGVRYLVKRGDDRVVSTRIKPSNRALAMGTTIDPTFAFPLPILGINYLNFDVRHSGKQLALLYGGVFALGNVQAPRLGRTPFDGSVDFFGIAVPGTDIRFDATGERRTERVLNIPMSTGLNIGYQFTPFQKVSGGYTWRYDVYFGSPDTGSDFVVPPSGATNGITAGYEFARQGYQVRASASIFRRSDWRAWGRPGDFDPSARTYRHQSIGASKDFLFSPFQTVHIGATWYDGARLDRFSMYQFGLFDELRMHGVPAAGVRFPKLVLARASYSFNVFNMYRLDLFLDQARGQDPYVPSAWRNVTGTGVAVTLKTPWNTMFTADIGKSFLPVTYRNAGSVVMQFLLLKPL